MTRALKLIDVPAVFPSQNQMLSKYVSAPCVASTSAPLLPLSLINPPLVGKTFLAASSNQKELAPRRVKLFSCGILVLIARHSSSATINPREFPKSLLMLPEPSRGNFWPSHRRAKYVYIDRGGQSQAAEPELKSWENFRTHTIWGLAYASAAASAPASAPASAWLRPGYRLGYGTKKSVSHAN